jgi:hypothetical protein
MTGARQKPLHIPWFITVQKISKIGPEEAERKGLDPSVANLVGIACSQLWYKRA